MPGTHRVPVAEGDERVIGFASFGPATGMEASVSVFELFAIYVDPKVQEQGAGRGLLRAAEHERRDAEAVAAQLWVLNGNKPAQQFYRSHGWNPDGASKDGVLFGVPVREIRFQRSLHP